MSEQTLQAAIERELANGPLRASELIGRLANQGMIVDALTEDSVRAAIWDLVENNRILWKPDGRLASPQYA